MELTYHRVDLAGCEAKGQKPADMIKRDNPGDVWYVAFSPLHFDRQSDWRYYRTGQQVIIPVFPYQVSADPVDALGYAFQLGVNALHQIGGSPVRRLHLALGSPIQQVLDQDTGQTSWLFQIGFGVVLA